MREFDLIETLLRPLAGDPAARGLLSDAAVLAAEGADMALTKDMMAEGVHFLPDDPPASIGWRLVAVNASDLAATGAVPRACLLGLGLGRGAPMHGSSSLSSVCSAPAWRSACRSSAATPSVRVRRPCCR
ncbi:AIR synthase related protein [Hankyongella ginsenosidimutans]|uniref:AIR synthase related protein n=1 Tax=Hankyongella ginsenosidimutans TaxID=1763828 RepID=UPI001FE4C52E|nr:AIR synthase related protein [Hankyongella ginsenosidimutans]